MILRLRVFRFALLAHVVFILLGCNSDYVEGLVFTRCQLARELLKQGFPKEDLREWVCLIEEVSGSNTKRMEGPHRDDSVDLGLFQINSHYFCRDGKPGGECKVTCASLLSSNITLASRCAMYIYANYDFEPWDKYYEKCIYYLPSLRLCGIYY